MAADRLYTLYPLGPDGESFDVWAEHRDADPLMVTPREILIGAHAAVPVIYPESTRTVRIRWRAGISIRARWVDQDGNTWKTDGFLEKGRRQWLDVQIFTYQDNRDRRRHYAGRPTVGVRYAERAGCCRLPTARRCSSW